MTLVPFVDEESSDPELWPQPTRRSLGRPAAALAAGLVAAGAALGALYHARAGREGALLKSLGLRTAELAEEPEDPCSQFPYVRIERTTHSNLGGKGPDSGDEGIVYQGHGHRIGMGDGTGNGTVPAVLHFHALGAYQNHDLEEGANITGDYEPMWPTKNGIDGHFAQINLKPGHNGTFRVYPVDPVSHAPIAFPLGAMTFFDFDTGKDNVNSVEHLTISGYSAYFLTNTTQISVTHNPDGTTTFTATKEGSGSDNPTDPLELTVLQKDKTVSFEFTNMDSVTFELGCTAGSTGRVFDFVYRPALRCASTRLEDGTLLAANDPSNPFVIVRGGAPGPRPALAALVAALALVRLL